jgi:exopolyphosphatase/guanosine-5'-triphosphate,3'-diphosphate pyrophosphatase
MIAIDLGSNTLRLVKLNCKSKEFEDEFEKIVKTADMLESTGKIQAATVSRVIVAIKDAQKRIDFSNEVIRAVTTQAVRQAVNRNEVLEIIEKETGVRFSIISGEEEAELTLLAVKNRLKKLKYESDNFVLGDIGGGSIELIFHIGNSVISKSFSVGIVTIAQRYKSLSKIKSALTKEMQEIKLFSKDVYKRYNKVDTFIATAGTPTTIASLKLEQNYATYNAEKINGTTLQKYELDIYLEKLLSMSSKEQEKAVGTGRSELIAAGILIYKEIFNIVGIEKCIVIDDGLREGLALRECLQDIL